MSSIKVGDRIRDYSRSGITGTVKELFGDGVISFDGDNGIGYRAHIKCVRKLRKKKRREVWFPLIANKTYNGEKQKIKWREPYYTEADCRQHNAFTANFVRPIRFVEAKEQK